LACIGGIELRKQGAKGSLANSVRNCICELRLVDEVFYMVSNATLGRSANVGHGLSRGVQELIAGVNSPISPMPLEIATTFFNDPLLTSGRNANTV
jgi:hypothetical protein